MSEFMTKPVAGQDFHIYGEVFRWHPLPSAPGHPIFGEMWIDSNGYVWRADQYELLVESIEVEAKYDSMSDEEFERYCEARDARLLELRGNGRKKDRGEA